MPDKQREVERLARDMLAVADDYDFIWDHADCVAVAEEVMRLREAAKQVIDNSLGTKPRHTKARDGSCRDDCIPCGIENLRKAVADA
jgi:hypothetical protein